VLKKSIDKKSTMFEFGSKDQQEAELKKPRDLPLLISKERLPKKTIPEPRLSKETWAEAKHQSDTKKAMEELTQRAKMKKPSEHALRVRSERKARLAEPSQRTVKVHLGKTTRSPKAKIEKAGKEKHYGTHYGTKDPKGSTKRIAEYKTKGGKIKSPPDSPKGREEMASEMIAHHQHHLGRHPGGRAQAIAIGLNQAGMSQDQTRKAMGNAFIQESAEARLGEMFGVELDLSPVDLMKSMTLASEADVIESLRGIGKAIGDGNTVKAYVDFKNLTQKIATRGGVDNPTAVATTLLKKGNPGGMSGYEKGVAMYGTDGMKKMAQGHLTSEEMKTQKAYPLGEGPKKVGGSELWLDPIKSKKESGDKKIDLGTAPPHLGKYTEASRAEKAMGKQEEEEFVPKDKPDISKMGPGPSVGAGIGGASGGRPSVGTGLGKGVGEQKKGYKGEWKTEGGVDTFSGGEKDKPLGTLPHEQPGFKAPSLGGSKPPPMPHEIKVGTSGGFKTGQGEGGPHMITSAKPEVPAMPKVKEPSMEPGSTLSLTSLKEPGSKSVKKAMRELMEMSKGHGGKGPAKTGGGEWHCPNAGPAYRGVIEWDEEENQAGSGRAQTGAGTPHPPNRGPAKTGAGETHHPNAGPAQTGVGERHWEGREVSKAMKASSVPRLPRGMAASMDTWRSATSVLTRTNALLRPQIALIPDSLADGSGRPSTHTEFYKSDLMSCENCGRTFAKSHGECPTCIMSKALTCKSCGSAMHKGRDGDLRCSACGQGTMKALDQKSDGSIG